jgi:hypothetical protein
MASKKKIAKPREMNPPKDKYKIEDRSSNPNVPGASSLKGTHWAKYVSQPNSNLGAKLSWPKGGGVSSSPAPAMSKSQQASLRRAANAELRAKEVRRNNAAAMAESKKKNAGRKGKGVR